MHRENAGFTLVELLVVMLVTGVVMGAVVSSFQIQQRAYLQQEALVAVEQNLRVAVSTIKDHLRTSGYALPGQLDMWMPWEGMSRSPQVSTSEISVAYCSPEPVATLTAAANLTDTSITVTATSQDKPHSDELIQGDLIMIDGRDPAQLTSGGGNSLQIDTDINTTGSQGVTRQYPIGTPICRVDAYSFFIDQMSTGESVLVMNNYREQAPIAEGITNLQVTQTAMKEFEITLTAQTLKPDLWTGDYITREISATVPVKN